MGAEVKAVVGTNAWGDALYGKMLRGSYVEEDVIRGNRQCHLAKGSTTTRSATKE